MIAGLEKMLAQGKDSPELRFGLGNAYLAQGDASQAAVHLQCCVAIKPDYSAAWKLLAKAQQAQGLNEAAIATYHQGIFVAQQQGDKQTEKEMQVFLKRLMKKQ
ncbi:MAG: Tfp pilus assembly protein PilF [Motiliproteus sp.]|jgi:Tfp pilus assembly protein PilF